MNKYVTSKKWKAYFYFPMFIYVTLILFLVIFRTYPIYIINNDSYFDPRILPRTFNLIPFNTFKFYINPANNYVSLLDVIGNVFLFLPLGAYVQLYNTQQKIVKSALVSLGIGFFVELSQFLFATGAFDIDDILANFIGSLLGIFSIKLLFKIVKDEKLTIELISIISFSIIPFAAMSPWLYFVSPSKSVTLSVSAVVIIIFFSLFFISIRKEKPVLKVIALFCLVLLSCVYFIFVMPATI